MLPFEKCIMHSMAGINWTSPGHILAVMETEGGGLWGKRRPHPSKLMWTRETKQRLIES